MKGFYSLIFSVIISFSCSGNTDSLTLYLFLLDDCPICIQYTPTLNELHAAYGEEIAFIGYFPNFSSKPEKIEEFKKQYGIQFPLFTDYYKSKAKLFNAQITPEVILYDHEQNQILYQGRIDNKFFKLGRRRNVVTEHDLKNAIENRLNDLPIEKKYVEAIGCYINYSDNFSPKTKNHRE
ncbi:MAG: redoxin domain-containing protein [Saprospiraceae bacterium]|nr:redoxin domain-containing protein [Saprospiraceae bacterium]